MIYPKCARKILVVVSMLCLAPVLGDAQANRRDMAKEATIWKELEAVAPEMVDVFKQATERMDAHDAQAAVPLFQKVVDAAPQFDAGLRRLGMSLWESGESKQSVEYVELAVHLRRTPDNLSSLAIVLGIPQSNQPVPKEGGQRALALVNEAIQNRSTPDDGDLLVKAQLSLSLGDMKEFHDATAKLIRYFPDKAETHYFNAVRAVSDNKWTEAEDEIRRAGQLGLPQEDVDRFLASGVQTQATEWRYAWYAACATIAWMSGLLLLFVSGKTLSTSTLRSIEHDSGTGAVSASELKLRKIYRRLIDVAGYYYYVSLPFVMLLLIAIAVSVFTPSWLSGTYPFVSWPFLPSSRWEPFIRW
jgi:hypothetical protein